MFLNFTCKNYRLLCPQQSKPFLRNIFAVRRTGPVLLNKSRHRVIYEFPYIKLIAPILRTKYWVPTLGCALAPLLYMIEGTGDSAVITVTGALTYNLTGVILSKYMKNTVGRIYINRNVDEKDVMISSIDAAGRRVDRIHNLDDILYTDFPTKFSGFLGFVCLIVKNSDLFYNVNVRNCKFIDLEACNSVLGLIRTTGEKKIS